MNRNPVIESQRTRTLLCWSGGKDSALALAELRRRPEIDLCALLTTVTETDRCVAMHGVPLELIRLQAESIGLPLIVVEVPPFPDNAMYQRRMAVALSNAVDDHGIQAVAFGDLFLEDLREYRESMLEPTGLRPLFPIWKRPTDELAAEFIASGFRAILACVDTDQLPGRFAGRPFDLDLLEELPAEADPCGEGGEFHTFVYDGPIFRQPIPFRTAGLRLVDDRFHYQDVLTHSLVRSREALEPG